MDHPWKWLGDLSWQSIGLGVLVLVALYGLKRWRSSASRQADAVLERMQRERGDHYRKVRPLK